MLPFPICFRTFPSYILSCFALNILICSYCISVRNIAVNLALFLLLRTEDGRTQEYTCIQGQYLSLHCSIYMPVVPFRLLLSNFRMRSPISIKFHFYFPLFISHKKLPACLDSFHVQPHYCQIFNVRCVLVLVQLTLRFCYRKLITIE